MNGNRQTQNANNSRPWATWPYSCSRAEWRSQSTPVRRPKSINYTYRESHSHNLLCCAGQLEAQVGARGRFGESSRCPNIRVKWPSRTSRQHLPCCHCRQNPALACLTAVPGRRWATRFSLPSPGSLWRCFSPGLGYPWVWPRSDPTLRLPQRHCRRRHRCPLRLPLHFRATPREHPARNRRLTGSGAPCGRGVFRAARCSVDPPPWES
mmetsp:Transcript_17150/g.43505  ORF Transcript_17150/g.43505 Transcript_17150/m.43505 type:complete len:209 (+) Transcript_17150:309-935(+)